MRTSRVLRYVFGGFLLPAALVLLILAIMHRSSDLSACTFISAVASFFLLRKTKRDRAYSAIPKWVDYTKYCAELLRRAYE